MTELDLDALEREILPEESPTILYRWCKSLIAELRACRAENDRLVNGTSNETWMRKLASIEARAERAEGAVNDLGDALHRVTCRARVAEDCIADIRDAVDTWTTWGDRPARDLIDRINRALTGGDTPQDV